MKIKEIIDSENQQVVIDELKSRRYIDEPDIDAAEKALDPLKHDVFDPIKRPDKMVRVPQEEVAARSATSVMVTRKVEGKDAVFREEPVARIGLDLPSLIVKRAVAMIFGNDVIVNAKPEDDSQKKVLEVMNKIRHSVKESSLNRKIARAMFSCKEAAELWFAVPVDPKDPTKKSNKYGIESPFKLRCVPLSPLNGDKLYPYFDQTGDMIAFGREYSRQDEKKATHTYFEAWTDEEHVVWERVQTGYEVILSAPHTIGKIPVIFGNEDQTEFEKVLVLIDRLEKLLSNFADTNDYHASPKIFVKGKILGFGKKGESGQILQGDKDTDAHYLSWDNAPESVKTEIETLLRMIYTMTQTPDISFDAVKGIGSISGTALKLLFTDAHLKVLDHREVFDEYLERRYNVIKAFIGQMDVNGLKDAAESLITEPEIRPFMITDDAAEIDMWVNASGGQAIVSQETAIRRSSELTGVTDPKAEAEAISAENTARSTFNLAEPTDVLD